MADEPKRPENLDRATQAEMRETTVPLNELFLDPERHSHREMAELTRSALDDLMKSLRLEGQQVPIEFFTNDGGKRVVIKGHRRVTASRFLAEDKAPDFFEAMPIRAIEVVNSTPEDRLVRSIADNCQRRDLSAVERMRAAKRLFDFAVPIDRAAWALGVSPKTYERDLRVARHAWMLAYVFEEVIGATTAAKLLETAEQSKNVPLLKDGIEGWVADRKRAIRERDRRRRAEKGEGLKDSEKKVKQYLKPDLVKHWLQRIKDGKPLDDDSSYYFPAEFDPKTSKLRVPSVSMDLAKEPIGHLAKVAGTLQSVSKALSTYLQRRRHEQDDEPIEIDDSLLDLDYVRQLGLDRIADQLAEQQAGGKTPDAGDIEVRVEPVPRDEENVLDEIDAAEFDDEEES